MTDHMSLSDIKANLADVVTRAEMGQPTIGMRRGKRVVAVVPVEWLDKYLQEERARVLELIESRRSEPSVNAFDTLAVLAERSDRGKSGEPS